MSSSEALIGMPRSAIRYRPRRTDPHRPVSQMPKKPSSNRRPQHSISPADLTTTQIMPNCCFVVLGMMISFVLLYAGAVLR